MSIKHPKILKNTKIVCTIGPASESKEILEQLMKSGMNVCRLNFSHGSHEEHLRKIKNIKAIRRKLNLPVAIMLDTKGPEIRLKTFKNDEKIRLEPNQTFTLTTRDVIGDDSIVSVTYEGLANDVEVGSTILIDDGLVSLKVKEIIGNTDVICTVQNEGIISNKKGVNLPGTKSNLPALTEKDIDDIKFGIENGIDLIAVSFVRKKEDIYNIRKILEENGGDYIKVIAKIENQEGVDNIDSIINSSDGIMVARGDLGVEIQTELIPIVQKEIIRKCNEARKPVITATQMLDSMIRNPRPTRAETTDVANAIIDGTDCVMLSGETASGNYPIQAVNTMRNICITTELSADFAKSIEKKGIEMIPYNTTTSISKSTCTIASQLNAKAIVACTSSGATARYISSFRPKTNIIACTTTDIVARSLSICWGVHPILIKKATHTDELIDRAIVGSLQEGYVTEGDLIVLTAGIPLGISGTSNLIKVHVIGDILGHGIGIGTKSIVGNVCIGSTYEELKNKFKDGDIIVAKYTDSDLTEFLEKASGIVTETGGLTSHAAISAIHFNIPAILGFENATEELKDNEIVTLDPLGGIIYKGEAKVI